MTKPATFVLVHGAWHGGWCYQRVAQKLRARGHSVYTPTLSGLGERSHEFSGNINLTTHITDVVNLIKWEGLEDVVLLGHSYGGMVITGAADRVSDKIASLVYLDAFIPGDGQSLHDLVPPAVAKAQWDGAAANGGFAIPPVPAAGFAVNEKDQAWVDALCTPHPIACCAEKLKLTGAVNRIAKKSMIVATGWAAGRAFKEYYERVKNDPAWSAFEAPCGHDIMVDMPDLLVELLEKVA